MAVSEPSVKDLEAALTRHASAAGEVYPSGAKLIDAEEHWSGRLWEVTRLVMADQETMRYLAGGNRPDEVATCASRWSESTLDLDQIKAVFAAKGYDPEPFEALSRAGLLTAALEFEDGTPRIIHGEHAGAWISDTFAMSSDEETLDGVAEAIGTPAST